MGDTDPQNGDRLTQYLHALSGDTDDAITARVYAELRTLAKGILGAERRRFGQTAAARNVTTVIHDCWLRLRKRTEPWDSRAHFFGAASLTVRRLLIEEARRRSRGPTVALRESDTPGQAAYILSVDELLRELETLAPRPALMLSYRLFGGLRTEIIAELEGVSERTVQRDLAFAEAWLKSRLADD
jgi:RNA polymerase sigma factor (TIGR02999 family)